MKNIFLLLLLFYISCKEERNPPVQLDEYLSGQAKYFRFNGNVLVAEKGKVIYQKSFGFADFDSQRILNDSSVFELASVSKQFTAMAILMLIEKEKIKLTDTLRQYFPELPYSCITIRQMLTHTSGLPDYESAMNKKWDHHKIAFNKDMIAFLSTEKLPANFLPGTKWEYSNTAFALLASIVEKQSGQTFRHFLAENIFTPLGMVHSRIYNTRRSLKDTIVNYAYGYGYSDSLKKYILPDTDPDANFVIYLDGIQGDGVVNSTTGDLLKWDKALKNHSLLTEAVQAEMLKGQELADTANNIYYGYGVFITKKDTGTAISHSGGWPGYTTFLTRNIDEDRTIIILSNNNSNSPALASTLEAILLKKPFVMPYEHTRIAMDSVAIDKFTGSYQADSKMKLERRGEKLFRVLANGQSVELIPESVNKFFYSDGTDRQVEFEMDEKNTIKKIWFIGYGIKREIKKIG